MNKLRLRYHSNTHCELQEERICLMLDKEKIAFLEYVVDERKNHLIHPSLHTRYTCMFHFFFTINLRSFSLFSIEDIPSEDDQKDFFTSITRPYLPAVRRSILFLLPKTLYSVMLLNSSSFLDSRFSSELSGPEGLTRSFFLQNFVKFIRRAYARGVLWCNC